MMVDYYKLLSDKVFLWPKVASEMTENYRYMRTLIQTSNIMVIDKAARRSINNVTFIQDVPPLSQTYNISLSGQ